MNVISLGLATRLLLTFGFGSGLPAPANTGGGRTYMVKAHLAYAVETHTTYVVPSPKKYEVNRG